MFDALARFAAGPRRAVTFLMGNHDPGLLFAGVRDAVGRRVGGTHRFVLDAYDFDGVHVEHGMQREPMNAFNPARYFREKDGERFLNLPIGSRYIIHVLNEEKAQRPYIDKVAPFTSYYRWAIFNDPEAVLRITARSLAFAGAAFLRRIPHLDPEPLADVFRRFIRFTAFPTLEHEARHLLARKAVPHGDHGPHPRAALPRVRAGQGLREHRHLERHDLARRGQPRPDGAAHLRPRRVRGRPPPGAAPGVARPLPAARGRVFLTAALQD